ncbi:interferon-induced protein 44-like [Mercenaria mercenaria]|uniref:interferon-induced protein 44-like n=1 Tax=Mercenaria mercenaria TaxID=6596 RepID=UPI00234F14B5|nr:interferon-induced protein 44-like [Mercenaria mercenaria]
MTGPVGKSSFYNTIDTLFRGRITQRACSGFAEQIRTILCVTTQSGDSLKFVLCDTPGIEDSTGLNENECSSLLDGNMPNFYQLNQDNELPTKGSEEEITTQDRIDCVLLCA